MTRILAGVLLCVLVTAAAAKPEQVEFQAADEVRIFGDIYALPGGKSAPIVLLFHQARGDARGEYAGIASRLLDNGYNVFAIDQRSGGDLFGRENRTVAHAERNDYGYCDVYPDLEAALQYIRDAGFDGPLAVWGSSYSAALVFQLAARHPDQVDAVLGFSPASGAPLAECSIGDYLDDLNTPALALRPQREAEIESVKAQMQDFAARGVQVHVADPGVHGSSMLSEERVGGSTESTWQRVLDFLESSLGAD